MLVICLVMTCSANEEAVLKDLRAWFEKPPETRGELPRNVRAHAQLKEDDLAGATDRRLAAVVKRLEVYLNKVLVDLEKPVTIMCNGEVAHNSPVERRLDTLVETFIERCGPNFIFPVKIGFEVPE